MPQSDSSGRLPVAGTLALGALAVILPAGVLLLPTRVEAVPSFARQTGQPCAACHTAFPELTPFGRRFKLGGYTLGGGDSKLPPFAAMVEPGATHTQKGQPGGAAPGFGANDTLALQQASLFYGGQIYGNLGAFVQTTYDGVGKVFTWDNTDVRYADQTRIGGLDVVYGITVHNNPTVQDVWNTTPAWSFPFASSALAPAPDAATMIEGNFAARVVGVGAYTFWNDILYAELTGYQTLSPGFLKGVGVDAVGADSLSSIAPYWRLAIEPNRGDHSLELGTFGMVGHVHPGDVRGFGSNDVADFGFDAQYQYNGDPHTFTVRLTDIYEKQHLASTFAQGNSSRLDGHLNSFKLSASYIYDHTWSLTGEYFDISGNSDFNLYNIGGTSGGFSNTSSPNSRGFMAEAAYLPFSHGGPSIWPWFNTRIGLQYVYYTKFDGSSSNYDGAGRNAHDNNTLFLYALTAF